MEPIISFYFVVAVTTLEDGFRMVVVDIYASIIHGSKCFWIMDRMKGERGKCF